MFDNVGEKIKIFSVILFWINVALSVIGFIAYLKTTGDAFFAAFLILIIGAIFSLVFSWFLYGFGVLVSNSETQVSLLESNNNKNEAIGSKITAFNHNVSETKAEAVSPIIIDEETVKCPICGFEQRANRSCCFRCAIDFKEPVNDGKEV